MTQTVWDDVELEKAFPDDSGLSGIIRYALLGAGKRIRPRLAVASGRTVGLDSKVANSVGAVLEMVHCFSLIHDDLPCMDNDDFRRGKATVHKAYGEAAALLAGDSLLAAAFEKLASIEGVAAPHLVKALKLLAQSVGGEGMCKGQFDELAFESLEELMKIHQLKTGTLFKAAILIPAILKGFDESHQEYKALELFSEQYGIAFQIIDDIEDQDQVGLRSQGVLRFLNLGEAKALAQGRLELGLNLLKSQFRNESHELERIGLDLLSRLS